LDMEELGKMPEAERNQILQESTVRREMRVAIIRAEAERARLIQRMQHGNPPKLVRVETPMFIEDGMIVYEGKVGIKGNGFDFSGPLTDRSLISERDFWLGFADIFDQLAELHAAGIVWRDFKLENIYFGPRGAIVSDLGSLMTREQKLAEGYFFRDAQNNPHTIPPDVTPDQLPAYLRSQGFKPEAVYLVPLEGGVTADYYVPQLSFRASRGGVDFYRQDYMAAGISMDQAAFGGITRFEERVVAGRKVDKEVSYPALGIPAGHEAEARSLIAKLRTIDPSDSNYNIRLNEIAKKIRSWYQNPQN
jgi:serine/threonine protein kinase